MTGMMVDRMKRIEKWLLHAVHLQRTTMTALVDVLRADSRHVSEREPIYRAAAELLHEACTTSFARVPDGLVSWAHIVGDKSVPHFAAGQRVRKVSGDYTFEGVVMAVLFKRDGRSLRVVVENDQGVLHIFNPAQLVKDGEEI